MREGGASTSESTSSRIHMAPPRENSTTSIASPTRSEQRSQPINIFSSSTFSTASSHDLSVSSFEGLIATPLPSSTSSCSPTPPKTARRKLVRGGAPPSATGLHKISSLSESHSFTPTRAMMTIGEDTAVDYSERCGTDDPIILAELRRNALKAISAAPKHDWLVREFQDACRQLTNTTDLDNAALPLRALLTGQISRDLHELGLPVEGDDGDYVPDNVMSFLEHFLENGDLELLRDAVEAQMSPAGTGDSPAGPSSKPCADGVDPFELMAKLNALGFR